MSSSRTKYGFEEVSPEQGVVQVWANPRTIAVNPDNPKNHPPEQTEAVGDFIDRHGWLKPLLFNLESGHLVDGHDRLQLAIERGYPAVPVWVISCSEDDEAEVILALDESGRGGTWEPGKTAALMDRLKDTSSAVTKLIADLAQREGLVAYRERVAETPTAFSESNTPPPPDRVGDTAVDPAIQARAMAAEPPSLSASRVRLVQLFVDADKLELFNEWVDDLQEMWGVASVTDAVLRTLSDAHLAYLRGGRRRRS